jgi:hypothetical protein
VTTAGDGHADGDGDGHGHGDRNYNGGTLSLSQDAPSPRPAERGPAPAGTAAGAPSPTADTRTAGGAATHAAADAAASAPAADDADDADASAPAAARHGQQTARTSRWLLALFLGLAALHVAPLWSVAFVPTLDGPCHVYNAWVLRQYGNHAQYPLFARYYEIDPRPLPNWLGHALLAGLMVAAPPAAAEKLLLSGYALLLLAAFWYLAGTVERERRCFAFLGFPFVWNATFGLGFYNFCLSLALFLFALGYWWRHRARFGLPQAAALNALLLLCYFAHIVSQLLALAAIGVLWLATLSEQPLRRHLRHLLYLAPQLPLPLWFVWHQHGQPTPAVLGGESPWPYLTQASAISLDAAPRDRVGLPLVLVYLALLVATLIREGGRRDAAGRWRPAPRPADGFLALGVLATVLLFAFPDGMAGGSYLRPRLGLYPFLVLVPWFSARIGAPARRAVVALLVAIALVNLFYVASGWRHIEPLMRAYLYGLDPVPPNKTLLPLLFGANGNRLQTPVLGHLTGYAAAGKGLVDWDNYEAMTTLFPLRFRPGVSRLTLPQMLKPPRTLHIAAIRDTVDYIYAWHLPAGTAIAAEVRRYYDPVLESGPISLFVRAR